MSDGATSPTHSRDQLTAGVATTLTAAGIPASKLGPARRARLTDPERELYFWILRRFASSGRPTSSEIRERAAQLQVEVENALATLAREDLVHRGSDGEITVAYPFSGPPTAHRVRFPDGHDAYAMCAIDALGIAPMLGEPIEIASRDPLTGEQITVELEPDGHGSWESESAVVVSGRIGSGDSCGACCPVLNFFSSATNAERWLTAHPDVQGSVISLPEAIAAGRTVFGDILKEA